MATVIEIDNLKIENLMGSDGDMWHRVIELDTDEVLFVCKEFDYAENFALCYVQTKGMKKEIRDYALYGKLPYGEV